MDESEENFNLLRKASVLQTKVLFLIADTKRALLSNVPRGISSVVPNRAVEPGVVIQFKILITCNWSMSKLEEEIKSFSLMPSA